MSIFSFSIRLTKLWLAILLFVSAATSFATTNFGVELTKELIESLFNTNEQELSELIDYHFFVHLFFFLVIPFFIILKTKLQPSSFLQSIKKWFLCLAFAGLLYSIPYSVDRHLGSQTREYHIEKYVLPINIIIQTLEYIKSHSRKAIPFSKWNKTEEIYRFTKQNTASDKPIVFVMLIGESSRSDHFSINGYEKQTNPVMEKEKNLITFTEATSCATRTVFSVPCMLSHLSLHQFKLPVQDTSVISILKKLGFQTYWFSRHPFTEGSNCVEADLCMYKHDLEKIYSGNSEEIKYDAMLLTFLDKAISEDTQKNKFIILNVMGSHANYRDRYPQTSQHSVFSPICEESIYSCDLQSLSNVYDNTIVYLDYFIGQIYKRLADKNAAVLFASDHGESLGENGIYLHAKSHFFAPKNQFHVPIIFWASDQFIKLRNLQNIFSKRKRKEEVTHDIIFHSILDCLNIQAEIIDPQKSLCHMTPGQ